MKLLLTNDDSFRAEGIKAVYDTFNANHNVTMIAPDRERSSCGHAISLGKPLRVKQIKDNIYSCSGFPADCILVGKGSLLKDDLPDLILSGINHGPNLSQDCYYSGTMAAAREASFRELKSISISLVTKSSRDIEHFDTATTFLKYLVDNNIQDIIPEQHYLNINVPNITLDDLAGAKMAISGFQKYSEEVVERQDTRGQSYYWVGGIHVGHEDIPESDCAVVASGKISVALYGREGIKEPTAELQRLVEGFLDKDVENENTST